MFLRRPASIPTRLASDHLVVEGRHAVRKIRSRLSNETGLFRAKLLVTEDTTHAFVGGVLYMENYNKISPVRKWGVTSGAPFIIPCGLFRHPNDYRVSCRGSLVLFSNPAAVLSAKTPVIVGAHLALRRRDARIIRMLTESSFGVAPSDSSRDGVFDISMSNHNASFTSVVLVLGYPAPGQKVLSALDSTLHIARSETPEEVEFACKSDLLSNGFRYDVVRDGLYPRLMRCVLDTGVYGKDAAYPEGLAEEDSITKSCAVQCNKRCHGGWFKKNCAKKLGAGADNSTNLNIRSNYYYVRSKIDAFYDPDITGMTWSNNPIPSDFVTITDDGPPIYDYPGNGGADFGDGNSGGWFPDWDRGDWDDYDWDDYDCSGD